MKSTLVVGLPLIILIGGWLFIDRSSPEMERELNLPVSGSTNSLLNEQEIESDRSKPVTVSIIEDKIEKTAQSDSEFENIPESTSNYINAIDTASLGLQPISDDEFKQIQQRLLSEPDYLTTALLELRSNNDPNRAKQLSALLADIDDPRIYQTAAELAYSGDPVSQLIGLDLLNRIQTHNSDARDIAIQLLGSESRPEILIATMNVIATPAPDATVEQRQMISDNLFLLSTHNEPKVRAHSLSLLGQWDKQNPSVTNALSNALQDPDSHVRARAVYAVSGTEAVDESLMQNLLLVLENQDESKATRQAAMLVLQNENLSGSSLRRFTEAQKSLRTRKLVN